MTETGETRPALRNLELQQQTLAESLREGFATPREVIYWAQDVIVASFGYLDRQVLSALCSQSATQLALLGGEAYSHADEHLSGVLTTEAADRFRRRFEAELLTPAFHKAYRNLRTRANEYVDVDDRPEATNEESSVALRPSLARIDERQEVVLKEFLEDRLDDRDDLLDWTRRVNAAANGEASREVLVRLVVEPSARKLVLNQMPVSPKPRERAKHQILGGVIFPAFRRGVRELTAAAGERSETEEDNSGLASELGA